MITRRIFWLAVTLMVFVAPATAGMRAVDLAEENSALIIHDALPGKSELEQLRSTLIEAYGFAPDTTTLLTDSGASLDGIREALASLVERQRRASGQVLLYLSLPIYRHENETYFVPSGADKEKPWELLNVHELVKRLSKLRSFNVMVVYPSCQVARSSDIYSLRQSEAEAVTSLVYGYIDSIDIFGVCDQEAMRVGRDMGLIVSTPERRALLAQVIAEVLSSAGDDRTDFFGTEYLVEQFNAKGEELGLMSGRVQFPDYGGRGYMFYPQPSELSRYQAAYIEAEYYLQAEELLHRLASVASQGTDEFLTGAVAFFKNVSESQNAGLGLVARASDRDRLSLRAIALEVLAGLETPQADVTLFGVAENASVSSSIRGQAIAFIERRSTFVDVDVARIRALVSDPDEAVSVSAIRALGRLKDPESTAMLTQLAENATGSKTRTAAIQSLATIKDPNSQNFLLSRLVVEESIEVRLSLIKSIGELGKAGRATMELLRLLDIESDARVVRSILAALPKVSVTSTDDDVVRSITRKAKSGDETQRISAVYALGEIDTAGSEKTLRDILRQAGFGKVPESVRAAAAEGLGDLREDSGKAIKELEKAAFDRSAHLRKAAVDALGKIGNPSSIELLAEKLKDDDDEVRAAASTALRRLNTIENVQLIDNLSSDEERIRYEAVRRLRQTESSDAVIGALAMALGDESAQVRNVAQIALSDSPSEAVESALYESLSSSDAQQRKLAIRILGTRQTESSLAVLLDYDDSNPIVKAELVRALGNYEDEQAISRILDALETGHLEVQIASIRALANHRDHPDIRKKLEVLARTSRSSTIQKEAIRALGSSKRVKAPTRFEVD